MNLFSVFATIGLDTSEFDRGINQAENQGRGFGASFAAVGKAVAAAGVAIGGAMLGIGTAAMRTGGYWENSMNTIQSRTGMADEDVQKLAMSFRDTALEGNFTAAELAKASSKIAVSGQDAAHHIELMDSAMTLAAATGNSLGKAAYFVGNYLLKVGRDSSYAEKYVDLFTIGIKNSGIGLADLQNYVFRMTPAFEQFGASSETNVAILTRLYQAGIRGANLYSGMGTIMMQAATGVGNFADMMSGLAYHTNVMNGLSFEFYEGMTLNEAQLFELAKAMNEYEDSTRQAGIVAYVLTQTQQAAWFEFMNLAEEIQNEVIPTFAAYGVAAEMAALNNQGFGSSLMTIQAAGQDALKTIFDIINADVSEALGTAAERASEFAIRLRDGGDLHPIVQELGAAISELMAAIVGLATRAGEFALNVLPTLASGLTTIIRAATSLYPLILGLVAATKAYKIAISIDTVVQKAATALKGLTTAKQAQATATAALEKATRLSSAAEKLRTAATHKQILADELAIKAKKARAVAQKLQTAANKAGAGAESARAAAANATAIAETYATKAATARTTAKAAQFKASGAAAMAEKAHATAVAKQTVATKAATIAQKAKNLAMKLNPIGAVVAGIIALTGATIALVKWLNRTSEDTQALIAENDMLIRSTERLNSALETSANAHQKRIDNIATEVGASRSLLERIEELYAVEYKTMEQRRQMAAYVEMLNGSMEGLNLQYDMETGLLSQSVEAIERQIYAREAQARAVAAQERSIEIAREQIMVEEQLARVNEQHIAIYEKIANGEYTNRANRRALVGETQRLAEVSAELQEEQERLGQSFDYVSNIIAESMKTNVGSVQEFAYETENALNRAGGLYRDFFYVSYEYLNMLSAEHERLTSIVVNAFNEMSDETQHSISGMAETLQNNAKITRNWADNIVTITDELARKGFDENVTQELIRMAREDPAIAQMFVDDIESVFDELAPAIGESMEAVTSKMVDVFGYDREVIEAASRLIENIEHGMYFAIESANFDGLGGGVAEGFAGGIDEHAYLAELASRTMAEDVERAARDVLQSSSPSKVFIEIGKGIGLGFAEGIKNTVDAAISKITSWLSQATNTAESGASDIVSGVENNLSPLSDRMQTIFDAGTNKLELWLSNNYKKATRSTNDMVLAMDNELSPLPNNMDNIFQKAYDTMRRWTEKLSALTQQFFPVKIQTIDQIMQQLPPQMESAGQQAMAGFQNGISSMKGSIMDSVNAFVQSVAQTMQSALQMNSPSRLFERFGKYTAEGYLVGIEKMADDVYDTVSKTFAQVPDMAFGKFERDIGYIAATAAFVPRQAAGQQRGTATIHMGDNYFDLSGYTGDIYELEERIGRIQHQNVMDALRGAGFAEV